ncbi:MAG: hypothetical protein RLZZ370_105 [Bacteroidota bacterium]|jgi:tRNA threonylcarbamoyl adenosine modification protein (Sua5/YciO/YrdC/YwlC family)
MDRIELPEYYLDPKLMRSVAQRLRSGAVVVVPTDTVYALVCDPGNHSAVERMCAQVGKKANTALLSLLCRDFKQITAYTAPIPQPVFRLLRTKLPGPFTFILKASASVEKQFNNRRKTIGVRIPDHPVLLGILEAFDGPLMATSLHSDDHIMEYAHDPDEIAQNMTHLADLLVDSGPCGITPSTVVDCSSGEPELLRQGKGTW